MKQTFNTPEQYTEQPKETIVDCGKKTLMDNPTIADHIGSHFNLAFDYAKELVNENTRLRAQLYRLPILEQENAQLKEQQQNTWSEKETLKNALAKIVELENKLNFANPQLLSLSQSNTDLQKQVQELTQQVFDLKRGGQPKEPVYDAGWLWRIVKDYNSQYSFYKGLINFKNYGCLSPKDSAPIIVAGLAKHLNPLFEADPNQSMYCIQRVHEEATTGMTYSHMVDCAHIFISEQAAQKAIDILNQVSPEVLKNYLS